MSREGGPSLAVGEAGVNPRAIRPAARCPDGLHAHPHPEPVPPEGIQLLVEPEGGIVAPGGTVTLTCAISAQPPPQIHWIKDVSDPESWD